MATNEPTPLNDPDRLHLVRSLRVGDPAWSRAAALAARALSCADAGACLVGAEVVRITAGSRADDDDALALRCTAVVEEGVPHVSDDGSWLGVPVRVRGQPIGALWVSDAPTRRWSDDDRDTLAALAEGLGRVLDLALAVEHGTPPKGHAPAGFTPAQLLEILGNGVHEALWVYDPAVEKVTWVSPAHEAVWGFPARELLADPDSWRDHVHAEDLDRVLARSLDLSPPDRVEFRIIRDGEVRWLSAHVGPFYGLGGSLRAIVAVTEDVTDRVHAERARVRAASQAQQLFELAPVPIYSIHPDSRMAEVNPATLSLLGRTAEQVVGSSFVDLLDPADVPHTVARFQAVMSGEADRVAFEAGVLRPSGARRHILIHGGPLHDGERIGGFQGIAVDLTDQRRQEDLARSLLSALDTVPQSIALFRDAENVLYANATLRDGLREGWRPLPDEQAEIGLTRRVARARGSWIGRGRRTWTGEPRWYDMVLTLFRPPPDELFLLIARDVTEERAREQQIAHAERLASLGTLVGGVAHELNNPLTTILSLARLLLADAPPGEDRDAMALIEREARRAGRIVSDLRQIAHPSAPDEARAVDLNDVARHVLRLRGYTLRTDDVEVVEDLASDLPPVHGDRSQLEQVVLILVVNAGQALRGHPGARRITVSTRAEGRAVVLDVTDTGPGVPEADRARVFDPFFTTKAPGEGTGLGLSISHGIVRRHRGRLSVEDPPSGARFRVTLPASEVQTAPPPEPAPAPAPSNRGLRVLVVDDEPGIRRSLVRFLGRDGHRVETAEDGRAALACLDAGDFDAVLCDLRMPGMGGEALLAELVRRGDGTDGKLVFMTGDAGSSHAEDAIAGRPVVFKPFDLDEIARALARVAGS